tara:strand:+ start:3082 stop:3270 length:189 start_codon:yes stop_codon:yes gene_type:complete
MAERLPDKEYKPMRGDEFKKIYGSTSPPDSIAEKTWKWLVLMEHVHRQQEYWQRVQAERKNT